MGYAFVTSNIVDVRSEPSNRSERLNQVLFGETVRTRRPKDGFWLIEQRDGYAGWINERFLQKSDKAEFDNPVTNIVVTKTASITGQNGRAIDPFYLFYGTRLSGKKTEAGKFEAKLPDGKNIFLKASAVQPIIRENLVASRAVLTEARRFMGVPYLWGGISPAGFDCSGFVRAVLGRFGIEMARDTRDQIRQGEPVDRGSIKSGDLIFFTGHVGIAMGRDRLIHSSRSGGGVRINSLSEGDSDYRADLNHSFTAARRILLCT